MYSLVLSRRLLAASSAVCLTTVGLVGLTGLAPAEAAGAYGVVDTVPVGAAPLGVGLDPSTNTAYVTNFNAGSVSVIDGATSSVVTTVSVGSHPHGVAVDPSTHRAYVANYGGSSVSVIDGTTNTVVTTMSVGSQPVGVAVDPSTRTVYVANRGVDAVSVIDGDTNSVVTMIPVGSAPYGVAVDPSTHTVYVTNSGGSSVTVIDGDTNTVVTTIPVGSVPYRVGVDPSTHTAYVANSGGDSVSVIDGTTNSVVTTIPVGSDPYGVAVDPSTHTAYVANYGGDSVSVIDGDTNSVVATVPVGTSPHGVAVDPSTHAAYVANSGGNSVSVIGTVGADDATVSSLAELQALGTDCTGNGADPTTITLAADITAPDAEVEVACHAVLDLAGYDLTIRNVLIDSSQALTVDDSGSGGSLTADASASNNVAGIQTADAALKITGGKVTATGGGFAAGIGGTYTVPGGTTTIDGGTVVATGTSAAGIGGGWASGGGTTTINGGTVTATGGDIASGIGGGSYGSGGTTTVNGGDVTATGGPDSAGIGGGYAGDGGTVTVDGGTVTATGASRGAGIGGGYTGSGGIVEISGGNVTAVGGPTGGSAVGPGADAGSFGSLTVDGGVLRLPSGYLRVPDSDAGAEITVGPAGVIDGSTGPGATYALIQGAGQIDNGGRILLPTTNVTGNGTTVLDRHHAVSFDTQGGSAAPGAVTVFADTFAHGGRTFPVDPTKAQAVFAGWNTAADGSGDPVTATSTLPGSSVSGSAVPVTAYAQWQSAPAITGVAPSSGPTSGGTVVVITGTGFSGVSRVDFGNTGPAASYTVDSDTQITATSPAAPAPVVRHIRVTTVAGSSPAVTADRFTYGAVPAITGISPSSGPQTGGTVVVITGTGFTGATQVRFGLAGNATFTVESATHITATSPASSTTGIRNVTVRGPGGTSALVTADRFKYLAPPPAVTGIAPSFGPQAGGTVVVITGTGFTGATKVIFGVGGTTTFTVNSDTQITATSPSSPSAGTRHIRVTTPSGTSPSVIADRFSYH